jgi:hypothetical protein
MSIAKRCFTSDLTSRSYASLVILDRDDLDVRGDLVFAEESSISCVSARPPMSEPDRFRRP